MQLCTNTAADAATPNHGLGYTRKIKAQGTRNQIHVLCTVSNKIYENSESFVFEIIDELLGILIGS